jgi:hypothetical protein
VIEVDEVYVLTAPVEGCTDGTAVRVVEAERYGCVGVRPLSGGPGFYVPVGNLAKSKVPMSEWIVHPVNDNYLKRSAMWEDELPGYDPDAPVDPDDDDADDTDDPLTPP